MLSCMYMCAQQQCSTIAGAFRLHPQGLASYFSVIALSAAVLATGAFFQFQERPPTPPSESAAARAARGDDDVDNFLVTARKLLATPGFLPPLIAFVASSMRLHT